MGDLRTAQRRSKALAEVPAAGEACPAALGVADAQPLHGRRLLLPAAVGPCPRPYADRAVSAPSRPPPRTCAARQAAHPNRGGQTVSSEPRDVHAEPVLATSAIQGDVLPGLLKKEELLLFLRHRVRRRLHHFVRGLPLTSMQTVLDQRAEVADRRARGITAADPGPRLNVAFNGPPAGQASASRATRAPPGWRSSRPGWPRGRTCSTTPTPRAGARSARSTRRTASSCSLRGQPGRDRRHHRAAPAPARRARLERGARGGRQRPPRPGARPRALRLRRRCVAAGRARDHARRATCSRRRWTGTTAGAGRAWARTCCGPASSSSATRGRTPSSATPPPTSRGPEPSWSRRSPFMENGAFLVFRRLAQEVPEFDASVRRSPARPPAPTPSPPELLWRAAGGRWKSGAPVSLTAAQGRPLAGRGQPHGERLRVRRRPRGRPLPLGGPRPQDLPARRRPAHDHPDRARGGPRRGVHADAPDDAARHHPRPGAHPRRGAERPDDEAAGPALPSATSTSIADQFEFVQPAWSTSPTSCSPARGSTRSSASRPTGTPAFLGAAPFTRAGRTSRC